MFLVNPFVFAGDAFSPDDIANLQSWWDADDAASVTTSGGEITAWANQLGSAPSLVGYSASPALPGTTTVVGRTWADFNASNSEALRVSDPADADVLFGSGEMSLFLTFRTTQTSAATLLNKGSNAGGRYRMRLNHAVTGDAQTVLNDGTDNAPLATGDESLDDGNSHVFALIRDNSSNLMRLRLDGAEIDTLDISAIGDIDETSGSAFVAQLIVGGQPSGASLTAFFDGQIGEILFYGDALSGGDLSSVESYLMTKWGV